MYRNVLIICSPASSCHSIHALSSKASAGNTFDTDFGLSRLFRESARTVYEITGNLYLDQLFDETLQSFDSDFGLVRLFSNSAIIAQSEFNGCFCIGELFNETRAMTQQELNEAFWRTQTYEIGDRVYLEFWRLTEEHLGYRPARFGIKSIGPYRILHKTADNKYMLDFTQEGIRLRDVQFHTQYLTAYAH
jgi:hypothetical protein